MKRLILSLAAVAFLAAPAMAQADGLYISPEKQAILDDHPELTVETYAVNEPPEADKYCPGVKRAKDYATRARNWNGGTTWRLGMKVSACANNGGLVWRRISWVRYAAPSSRWKRVGNVQRFWSNGTAWSQMMLREEEDWGYVGDDSYWTAKVYINPHVDGDHGLWFSKGAQIR